MPAALKTRTLSLPQANLSLRDELQLLEPALLPSLSLAGFSSQEPGGDFYDVVPLTGERLLLIMADAMGNGTRAFRYATSLRLLVRLVAEWTQEPGELLCQLNRLIYEELSERDVFITAQAALLDPRRREFTLASAGHCPLLLAQPGMLPKPLAPEVLPLGVLSTSKYEVDTFQLQPRDCLLLYTDGVTESRNLRGEFYGQQRLEHWLARNYERWPSANQLRDGFRAELCRFRAGLPARDDETFLFVVEQSLQQALAA